MNSAKLARHGVTPYEGRKGRTIPYARTKGQRARLAMGTSEQRPQITQITRIKKQRREQ